jgi:DNA-binding NarL/FixJ family response regulator
MIVEDHAMVAEGLEMVIEAQDGLEVCGSARSVADAVTVAEDTQPDVAVVDYRLPDGTGADVTERLGTVSPRTRVLILTAMDGEAVLSRAIASGAVAFIRKTEHLDEIIKAVRAVGAGETYFSSDVLSSLVNTIRRPKETAGSDLTPRELEVLDLLAKGHSTASIIDELVISPHTARNHIRNILTKLHAHSKLEAVTIAAHAGLVHLD